MLPKASYIDLSFYFLCYFLCSLFSGSSPALILFFLCSLFSGSSPALILFFFGFYSSIFFPHLLVVIIMSLEAELRSILVRGQSAALERKAMMIFKDRQVYAVIVDDVSQVINKHYASIAHIKDKDKLVLEKYSIQQRLQSIDELAFSVIGGIIGSSHFDLLDPSKSAHVNWNAVLKYFRPSSEGQRICLQERFFNFRFRDDAPLLTQLTELNELVADLKESGSVQSEESFVVTVLRALKYRAGWQSTASTWMDQAVCSGLSKSQLLTCITRKIDLDRSLDTVPSVSAMNVQPDASQRLPFCCFCKKEGHHIQHCNLCPP